MGLGSRYRDQRESNDMAEEVVEIAEVLGGWVLGGVHDPVEGHVAVHRGDEGEGAGRTYQIVTMGEETEILGGVALGEVDEEIGKALAVEVFVEMGVVAANVDVEPLFWVAMVVIATDNADVLLVGVEEPPALEGLIVAATDMDTEAHAPHIAQPLLGFLLHSLVEGEELEDLGLVLQEEVVPAGIPALGHHETATLHQLLLTTVVGPFLVEMDGGNESPLGGILGEDVGGEVVVAGMADVEPRILIGEAHGHRRASMLAAPGIDMPVLQHIVGHAAFVVDEYHSNPLRFLITSRGSRLTRPVSAS